MTKAFASVFIVYMLSGSVSGHGRLMDPVSRSSAWRKGFGTPANYDDNQLYCGGASYQWERYGGKCGICGDPYGGERPNEAGGKYATGTITRTYTEGETITIEVLITAHHKGWFEFRLCPNNDVTKAATQACLDQNLLVLENPDGSKTTRYDITKGTQGTYKIKATLPGGVTCTQCVFQWKYNAGNSWGVDPVTRRGCLGCGPQEQFYGCADVQIEPATGHVAPTSKATNLETTSEKAVVTSTRPLSKTTTATNVDMSTSTEEGSKTGEPKQGTSTAPIGTERGTSEAMEATSNKVEVTTTAQKLETTVGNNEASVSSESVTNKPDYVTTVASKQETTMQQENKQECVPDPVFLIYAGMKKWCLYNRDTCPEPYCRRKGSENSLWGKCVAVGAYVGDANIDEWCKLNCAQGYCPESHCYCPKQSG